MNKQEPPTVAEMTAYCGETAELFASLNEGLSDTYATTSQIAFPYGNGYGWGIVHKKKGKLCCNIFAENNSFTVMVRLSDRQFGWVYGSLQRYTQEFIDRKYPCGDGGWIHYRVACKEHFDDVQKLLSVTLAA